MLDESGYEDTENENPCNNHDHNTLSKLANKAKTKIHFHTTNANRLSMYEQVKPKLGSCYAQKWSKRSLELTTIIDVITFYSCYIVFLFKFLFVCLILE